MIGIYCWINLINNKRYVGQSVDIERRKREHINNIGKYNTKISKAMNKYGINNFNFVVLEECSVQDLNKREGYWIHYYNTLDNQYGYNITDIDENGCIVRGQFNPNTNLTDADVIEIRHRIHCQKETSKEVYDDYSHLISYDSFWQAAHGVTWKHLDCSMIQPIENNQQGENNPRTSLTNQDVLDIRTRVHIQLESQLNVYADYRSKISFDAFRKIVSGETWKNVDCTIIKPLHTERLGQSKAKLTKEDVQKIRYEYENKIKTIEEIKKEYYYVTPITIRRVIDYKTWKNI